jgi:RNA methyltransferase, TrmH family
MSTSTGPLSARNTRVTAARRLVRRTQREAERAFLAEGPQAVREALARLGEHPGAVTELFASAQAAQRHPDLLSAASAAAVPVRLVTDEVLDRLSGTVTPQGLVAVCRFLDLPLQAALSPPPALVAVLAQVRDPGNAGAVLRAADAAGAGAVVLTDNSVDPYNGKCVRASAGSLFHLRMVTGAPVADAVTALRAAGLQVLAADAGGELDLDDAADDGLLRAPTAWLFGNEAWGLPGSVRDLADAVVSVPIHGAAQSLNLATAAAVCLYASARAQRPAPATGGPVRVR